MTTPSGRARGRHTQSTGRTGEDPAIEAIEAARAADGAWGGADRGRNKTDHRQATSATSYSILPGALGRDCRIFAPLASFFGNPPRRAMLQLLSLFRSVRNACICSAEQGIEKFRKAMTRKTPLSQSADPILFPIAALLAIAIFAVDTLSPLGMAVAVLYVVVVLLSVSLFRWRDVLLVSLGCAGLAKLGYCLVHGVSLSGAHFVRLFVSLAAIGITAFLALKNRSAVADLSEQARLLDLTHDSIFVRDMEDVITYWNRGS